MKRKPLNRCVLACLGASLLAGLACAKTETKTSAKAEPAKPAASAESAPATPDGETSSKSLAQVGVQRALESYERLREALAKDDHKRIDRFAYGIAVSAAVAARRLGAPLSDGWTKVADAATGFSELAKTTSELSKADDASLRKAFGEISQPLVALVAADPALRAKLHIFECPGVSVYNKWIQPSSEPSNPYRGTDMPTCGAVSTWE
jgi:hypothetical protein